MENWDLFVLKKCNLVVGYSYAWFLNHSKLEWMPIFSRILNLMYMVIWIIRHVCFLCDAFVDELDLEMLQEPNLHHRYCLKPWRTTCIQLKKRKTLFKKLSLPRVNIYFVIEIYTYEEIVLKKFSYHPAHPVFNSSTVSPSFIETSECPIAQ